ncbi:molecular chaperone HtpG [Parasulfuritortus cantonensis]|uniref:Chaperone protein HtpG n=1 Tax=Parasulfuritortus cantonensis TaxID=2528202 RepID=A0A4R1BD84_9PROT|nr:molecular chaperone HtpG [Parasulfuritortus cantonensis]TCJ15029.1 molecular chaperone HtpG [Parasulfuritortus cantonensis]
MSENVKETLGFQAEVKQLLHLMIHSLYSHKEIFVRELCSNAADAADKLRFEALNDGALYEDQPELKIWISADKEAKTLTIRDNGIGMNRQEVIEHIGTIAKSGTKEFFGKLTGDQQKDAQLIGQFGVGFYSSFIVADKVTLTTRRAGLTQEHGVRWESEGSGEYSLETVDKDSRGTEIVLHMKEGETEFLEEWRIKAVIRQYSDHIAIPIVFVNDKGEEETVNKANALWARSKNDITEEEYKAFYQHVGHDYEDPLAWIHARVEGRQDYTVLLYVPAHAPFDLWDREAKTGVKLYVKRVFIMEDARKLMPAYLRFMRGVIDAADLPLNVSREILQQTKDMEMIRAGCVKKALDLLDDLAENRRDDYAKVWENFGEVLKEGVGEDHANKDRIAGLCRFRSTASDEPTVSLADYIGRMKEGQDKVYYVTADSLAAAKSSPHLEIFRKKGIEVLLLTDRVDEWLVSHLFEFDGKSLASVAKGDLDLSAVKSEAADQAEEEAPKAEEAKALVERIQEALKDEVKEVRVSSRLVDSPACLVAGEHDMSGHLARMLKAMGQNAPAEKPILEVNVGHALVKRLDGEAGERFGELAKLVLDQAVLLDGGQLADPAGFVKRMNALLGA